MVWVSLGAFLQSPVQALLRPSMWVPKVRNLHLYNERWKCDLEDKEVTKAILRALQQVIQTDEKTFYDIHKVNEDGSFIRIFAFTRAEWLDIMEFTIENGNVKVHCFSSGLVPLIVPFAAVLNLAFFWVPFSDNGLNKTRTVALREALDIDVTLVDQKGLMN